MTTEAEKIRTPERRRDIFPENIGSLPQVCQEGVRNVLSLLKEMKEKKELFTQRTPEELNETIPQIQLLAQEFMDNLRPFKTKGLSWHLALNMASSTAYKEKNTLDYPRRKAWDAARGATWDQASQIILRREHLSDAVTWETIKDQPGFGKNPFLSLLKLYKKGMVRYDFLEVDEQERLVVDFPLKIGKRLAIACLVFGDGELGDKEVLFIHEQRESHSRIRPFPTPRIIKQPYSSTH